MLLRIISAIGLTAVLYFGLSIGLVSSRATVINGRIVVPTADPTDYPPINPTLPMPTDTYPPINPTPGPAPTRAGCCQ
jgi:hypothetical protein